MIRKKKKKENNTDACPTSLPAHPFVIMELGFLSDWFHFLQWQLCTGAFAWVNTRDLFHLAKAFLFLQGLLSPLLSPFIILQKESALLYGIAVSGMRNIYLGNCKFSLCFCHMWQMCLLSHQANGKSLPWEEWVILNHCYMGNVRLRGWFKGPPWTSGWKPGLLTPRQLQNPL